MQSHGEGGRGDHEQTLLVLSCGRRLGSLGWGAGEETGFGGRGEGRMQSVVQILSRWHLWGNPSDGVQCLEVCAYLSVKFGREAGTGAGNQGVIAK